MKKISWSLIISIVAFITFLVLTIILSFSTKESYTAFIIDSERGKIVSSGSSLPVFEGFIALAGFNKLVLQCTPFNAVFDLLADVFLYVSLAVALFFVGLGIFQLIKGKSLKYIDKDLFFIYGLYALIFILRFLFDKVFIVNYRPVVENINKGLESSFPSTHILICLPILLSGIVYVGKYMNSPFKPLVILMLAIISICEVIFRVLCGLHWITDIIASVVLTISLVSLYHFLTKSVVRKKTETKNKQEEDIIVF